MGVIFAVAGRCMECALKAVVNNLQPRASALTLKTLGDSGSLAVGSGWGMFEQKPFTSAINSRVGTKTLVNSSVLVPCWDRPDGHSGGAGTPEQLTLYREAQAMKTVFLCQFAPVEGSHCLVLWASHLQSVLSQCWVISMSGTEVHTKYTIRLNQRKT